MAHIKEQKVVIIEDIDEDKVNKEISKMNTIDKWVVSNITTAGFVDLTGKIHKTTTILFEREK